MEPEQQPVVNMTKIVFNLGDVDETLDDAILELQDFGDTIYDKSTEFRSKADRLYEIEKKLIACQTYVQERANPSKHFAFNRSQEIISIMARPDFKTTTGEDPVSLHITITTSQWSFLDDMSERTGKSKAAIVRAALEFSKENTLSS